MPLPFENARPATEIEARAFAAWLDYWNTTAMRAVAELSTYGQTALRVEQWRAVSGVKLSPAAAPLITGDEIELIKRLTINANTISRIGSAVVSWKYGIRPAAGNDFDIVAPAGVPQEQIETDTLGIAPLVYVVVIGALIVAGIWATSRSFEAAAKKQTAILSEKILAADREMLSSSDPALRSAWLERKRIEQAQIELTNKQTGFLTDVFGSKGGSIITLAIVAAIVFFASTMIKKTESR